LKKIIIIFIVLTIIFSCTSNNPIDVLDENKLSSAIGDFLKFETYWSGRWSERGYWSTNASESLFKKNKIQVEYTYNKSGDCYKVFIDELRSILFLTNKNDFYYVSSFDDTWWKETDVNEFKEMKETACKFGCKNAAITLSNKVPNKTTLYFTDKEKLEKIKEIVKNDITEKERHSFILDLLKKNGINKITVKIGISQLNYPSIYYFVSGIPFMGSIIYNPENFGVLSSDFFYWKELPDRKHYENIHKLIERNGLIYNL